MILPVYLSDEFDYNDTAAGTVWGATALMVAFYSVIIGPAVDKLGVAKSAMFSSILSGISGLLLAIADGEAMFVVTVIILFPISAAFAIPAGKIAPRRYTDEDTRQAAYSTFFWTLMVVQATTYGVVDVILHNSYDGNLGMNEYQQIFALGAVISGVAFLLSFFISEKEDLEEDKSTQSETVWGAVCSLCGHKNFCRYVWLVILTFGARFSYRMLEATLPKYMQRKIDEDVLYGTVIMATPITAIFAAPLLTSLLYCFKNYTLIIVGAVILAGFSFIPMIEGHYAVFVVYCVGMGLGQSIFQPRLWEYTMEIAPRGKEATYMAVANIPIMAGAMASGVMSGSFL